VASSTEGDRPSQKPKRFARLVRGQAALAPVPEMDDPGGLFDDSTAVAGYDAVTTLVPIADMASLVAAAQPTSMVRVLARPAALAAGSVVSHRAPAPVRPPRRRRRIGLALFVTATAAAVWTLTAYEIWYLFLR